MPVQPLDAPPQDPSSATTVALLWLGVAVVVALATVVAIYVWSSLGIDPSGREPFERREMSRSSPLYLRSIVRPPALAYLAGSGSNLPVTRALADLYHATHPGRHVIVFDSIGSTGGVMATYDDVVDIGLISRPLHDHEVALGVLTQPYARVPVVVATHIGVPDVSISIATLVDLYAGRKTTWSDGTPVVVLQRERGDSSHLAVSAAVPEFAAVNEAAYREARWRVVDSDQAMQEALSITEGAVGLFDLGAIVLAQLPVHPLEIEHFGPSEASVQSGRYPFAKDLAFVTVDDPGGTAADFLRFTTTEQARRLLRGAGYIPLPEDQ